MTPWVGIGRARSNKITNTGSEAACSCSKIAAFVGMMVLPNDNDHGGDADDHDNKSDGDGGND